MSVVVTGASGHLGANLVRELLARGQRVRAVVRGPSRALDGLDVERVPCDVRDAGALREALRGAEVVYHLAAVISIDGDPDGAVHAVNVGGARNVARAALACGARRLVHVSSVHAFDHAPRHAPLDEARRRPGPSHPAYDRSKAAGEAAVREVIAEGLDAVIVNPTGVIGPHDYEPSRMGRFFVDLAHRRLPALIDGGFDWVDARDVARSMVAAAERGRRGENYLLGGRWHSAVGLARVAAEAAGVPVPGVVLPMWAARVGAVAASAALRAVGRRSRFTPDAMHALRSNRDVRWDKAARELGHAPRPSLETVRDLYDCFERRGVLRAGALTRATAA